MATIAAGNQRIEVADDDPRIMAHAALYAAAERMGANNYLIQSNAHKRARRSPRTFRFVVTQAQRDVVDAMPKVLSGEMTPEQAMGLLWTYEVATQRGVKP